MRILETGSELFSIVVITSVLLVVVVYTRFHLLCIPLSIILNLALFSLARMVRSLSHRVCATDTHMSPICSIIVVVVEHNQI